MFFRNKKVFRTVMYYNYCMGLIIILLSTIKYKYKTFIETKQNLHHGLTLNRTLLLLTVV